MKIVKIILLIILPLSLAACASWKKDAYTGQGEQVENFAPVAVPHDLGTAQMREYYPIPDVVYEKQGQTISLNPPDYWPN